MRNAKKYPTQYKEKKEIDEFPYKLGVGKTFHDHDPKPRIWENNEKYHYINTNKNPEQKPPNLLCIAKKHQPKQKYQW